MIFARTTPAVSLVGFALMVAVLSACGDDSDSYANESGYDEALTYATNTDTSAWGASSWEASSYDRYGSEVEEIDREAFDDDLARDAAEQELADDSYMGVGMPYGCTDDCSGHEAGYRFRADNGYVGSNSDSSSFNEGGQAFEEAVDDRVEEMRSEYDSGGDAPY